MRLIDGDKVEQILRDMSQDENNESTTTTWTNALTVFADMINGVPTIDVEPVRHGKWLWERVYFVYSCSECGFRAFGDSLECADGTFQYCPACGAKMDEVEE